MYLPCGGAIILRAVAIFGCRDSRDTQKTKNLIRILLLLDMRNLNEDR